MGTLYEQYQKLKKDSSAGISVVDEDTRYVAFETLDTIFQAALGWIDAAWVKDPSLKDRYNAEKANRLTDSLEELWRDCLGGKAGVEDFRQTIGKWVNVCTGSCLEPERFESQHPIRAGG
ncbi:MAG: hypothetical protein NOU37_04205 [Candidatus Brocadiales bacterium]|nr:hypothetical protein [Candidatus Bathyanammoxibius amoris]